MPRFERKQEFLLMLGGIPIVIRLILSQLPETWQPASIQQHPLLASILIGIFIAYFDAWFLYPFYRSPLNAFPSLNGGRDLLRMAVETPRGKSALKWMRDYPDADVIHLRTRGGICFLVPISPDGFRDIMGQAQYSLKKPEGVRKALSTSLGYGLILSEGDEHKRQRKALTPAFSMRNINGLYPLMWKKAEEFTVCIKQEELQHGFVEVGSWASKLTLDIIGHAALSEDFNSLHVDDNEFQVAFETISKPSPARNLHFVAGFVLPQWFLKNLPIPFVRRHFYWCGKVRTQCRGILAKKKAALKAGQTEQVDIMRDIISSGSFTDEEIVDQMMTFVAAGHDTTAGSLTWCCYLMAQNPDIQLKLYEELHAHMPGNEDISAKTFDALPYLNGVCEEVFRLFAAVPATVREVTQETVICGVPVPQTTMIVIIPYAVNRNPKFWGPDAAECRPERWIDVGADGSKKMNKHGGTDSNLCGMTFLHGNRSCIGRDFAKAELKCAIASLFRKYEVSMWDPNETIKIVGGVTTKPDVGMKIKLTPRV